MLRVRGPRDVWAGSFYVVIALAALWIGSDYKIGTAGRMGPGYFPRLLAALLLIVGLISIARGFWKSSAPLAGIAWKPLLLILGACTLFAVLLEPVGLFGALITLCLIAAAASNKFAFEWLAIGGLLLLVVTCAVIFVELLGVPLPLGGHYLQPGADLLMAPIRAGLRLIKSMLAATAA